MARRLPIQAFNRRDHARRPDPTRRCPPPRHIDAGPRGPEHRPPVQRHHRSRARRHPTGGQRSQDGRSRAQQEVGAAVMRDVIERETESLTAQHAAATQVAPAPASPRSQLFDIDCKLGYTLASTTDFVFQIHALQGLDQEVVTESLRITSGSSYRTYEDPHIGHRFLRVQAAPGALNLRYRARVRVARPRRNLHAEELPIAALPDEVLHNLMATRYCESDLLGPAAIKLFGGLSPGYSRVAAICDWIQRNVDYRTGSSDTT